MTSSPADLPLAEHAQEAEAEHEHDPERRESREVIIERPALLEPIPDSRWCEEHADELNSLAGLELWLFGQGRDPWPR